MSSTSSEDQLASTQPASISILFAPGSCATPGNAGGTDQLVDLNLDQVLAGIVKGRESHRLEEYFHTPLRDEVEVRFRQLAFEELEQGDAHAAVSAFAAGMDEMRACLERSTRLRHQSQCRRWFLAAMESYIRTVGDLHTFVSAREFSSEALATIAEHTCRYAESADFQALRAETGAVVRALGEIRYSVRIRGLRVTVDHYRDEPDLTAQVERTFAKFRRGEVGDHLAGFPSHEETDPVEDQILTLVARLFPEQFEQLRGYCERHQQALDPTLLRFDREVRFPLAYLEYVEPLRAIGLRFSYPSVSAVSKRVRALRTFDIALASKLAGRGLEVVTNDLELSGRERVLVITGPNQGGKTTYARTFGQLHHLAALGLPVPGVETRLFLPDRVLTHFERREDLSTLRSRFEDELWRMREILEQATGDSVLVMNESFTSTALIDAVEVGTLVLEQILARDMLCACVTFVDELSRISEQVVSMMSTVAEEDPTRRTFEVVRKPADGLAYAVALAERHGLSHDRLAERLTATTKPSGIRRPTR